MSSIWTIRRSATDAKLTGLCGGVARHWGIDPVLVRVGWALLALSGGIGVVLYLAGWLLIPLDGRDSSALDDLMGSQRRRWPKEAWVALVVVACLISFAAFSSLLPGGLFPVLILAAIWYFGYYRTRTRNAPPPAPPAVPPAPQPFHYPGPATPFTEAAEVWRRRMAEHVRQTASPSVSPPVPPAPPAPVPTAVPSTAAPGRPGVPSPGAAPGWPTLPVGAAPAPVQDPPSEEERAHAAYLSEPDPVGLYAEPAELPVTAAPSRLTQARSRSARRLRLVGVLVLGLTLAGLGVADATGVSVPLTAYLGGALLVVGLTLVAATWLGRARGILPVGLLLAVALAAAWVSVPLGSPRVWNQELAYTSVAQLPSAGDSHDLGRLNVDLSNLELKRDAAYSAHVDAGSLQVEIPADVNVRVRYSVDQGVVFNGTDTHESGTNRTGELPFTAARPSAPTLTLDLSVDYGELKVIR